MKKNIFHLKMKDGLSKEMDSYEQDLERALHFVNQPEASERVRDEWVERLTKNLLALDEYPRSAERKRMILATQSVIGQLEVLFDTEKPPILLFYNSETERTGYLPGDHDPTITDSFKAVGPQYGHK